MQAIILAAGMGKRLKELTQNNTKCMIKVNGVTLIERMLSQLDSKNLSRIVIVVGYEGQKLIDYISGLNIKTAITYINNPIYDKTNNIYSLALAKDWLCTEDTLLFESDLIFEDAVIDELLNDERETLALVDKYESWMDGTCVKLGDDDSIEAFVPGKRFKFNEIKEYYKTVNIYKFSKHFSETHYVPFLNAYQSALGENEYYEQVLRVITMLDDPEIKAKRLSGQKWYEIDDIQDLDIAETIFMPNDDEKVRLMQVRFGGYWRYPKLLDYSYLVNPYFPPERMKYEMRANFDTLLTEYPSGMRVNSLLAAKNFGVHQENIIVGNGAAELIKALMNTLRGNVGFVRPTFEEYPNRYDKEYSIDFVPTNSDYSYTVDDLIAFFGDKDIDSLVVVNPDNPSGNYIEKNEMLRLVSWSEERKIRLIIDESFVDFADEEDATLIDQMILERNPHLYVMKSISKSYGVPGLRLGVLASGDTETIALLKKDVAIWNINSFAEFYMQIEEKYKKDYIKALDIFRKERKRFQDELANINGIRVIPSQANYVMVELDEGISPKEVLKTLLVKYNILIKELSAKLGVERYLRIAIRDEEDNNKLLSAMKEVLGTVR
ncbi:aminotransferase class I/II-fold pyridoxal phosphate-dependent enzyme [Butyrivibrio sp. VCD2006]|uniref:aminotransferase class I/II-fold pyridoxal phosphate-dependent enzyme n=1 Tax=Butyrivibrio sp. VCD2006 TaxID=1280664 RepID=UPI0004054151|nr:aminotransferase class I/II-fold pyridoxal phosphate-dependent enzyme [Butyrivibrio sp. VCD2006]